MSDCLLFVCVSYESRSRHYLALAISALVPLQTLVKAQMVSAMTREAPKLAKGSAKFKRTRCCFGASLKLSATIAKLTRDFTGLS
jgi:hypothetical protein